MSAPAPHPAVRFVEVAPEYAGQRIDNFLMRELKGVPKGMIYRILRTGQVRINGGRARPEARLGAGDQVRIPPVRVAAPDEIDAVAAQALGQRLLGGVLREDRELLVLDKPAGVAVHKGSGVDFGVIEALRAVRPELAYLELGHRLDRETSGCLLLAKTPAALQGLHQALEARQVDKRYLALLGGDWGRESLRVDAPLRKNQLQGGERMVVVAADGKPARTLIRPLQRYGLVTLAEVSIETGRTHQIRVHAAHAGHAVAGDPKYGDAALNRALAAQGLRRLFLHAARLTLTLGGRALRLEAPLAPELQAVLERLEAGR